MGKAMNLQLDRFAVVSDIHANAEAFRAVLRDIHARGIQSIICLGDLVGYGPDPKECIDLAQEHCSLTIMGNHDEAIFFEPYCFNMFALKAIHWTRDLLLDHSDPNNSERLHYLRELPRTHEQHGCLFVHGSPRDPVNEYITEMDVMMEDHEKMDAIFKAFEKFCFVGHTHVPSIITEKMTYHVPFHFGNAYHYEGDKLIVNVGSVGQPRDSNTKSSYVEVDGDAIHFRRIRYKYTTTMLRIKRNQDLHNELSDRLGSGV